MCVSLLLSPAGRGLSIPAGDDGGISPGGGGTIGGTGDITGVITGGTVDGIGGTVDGIGGVGVSRRPRRCRLYRQRRRHCGPRGTTGGWYLTLKSWTHVSGPVASPASGVAAMIGTRSTSQVTPRLLHDWPDNVTTFTQSGGCFRPLLR